MVEQMWFSASIFYKNGRILTYTTFRGPMSRGHGLQIDDSTTTDCQGRSIGGLILLSHNGAKKHPFTIIFHWKLVHFGV